MFFYATYLENVNGFFKVLIFYKNNFLMFKIKKIGKI